jgi:hypothetical protein
MDPIVRWKKVTERKRRVRASTYRWVTLFQGSLILTNRGCRRDSVWVILFQILVDLHKARGGYGCVGSARAQLAFPSNRNDAVVADRPQILADGERYMVRDSSHRGCSVGNSPEE